MNYNIQRLSGFFLVYGSITGRIPENCVFLCSNENLPSFFDIFPQMLSTKKNYLTSIHGCFYLKIIK